MKTLIRQLKHLIFWIDLLLHSEFLFYDVQINIFSNSTIIQNQHQLKYFCMVMLDNRARFLKLIMMAFLIP